MVALETELDEPVCVRHDAAHGMGQLQPTGQLGFLEAIDAGRWGSSPIYSLNGQGPRAVRTLEPFGALVPGLVIC
uniref:Uncharacterized protein n=1 Tax=Oryza meridionalis TaxID=40149 RepID=A0A0E0F063_9ORYZ